MFAVFGPATDVVRAVLAISSVLMARVFSYKVFCSLLGAKKNGIYTHWTKFVGRHKQIRKTLQYKINCRMVGLNFSIPSIGRLVGVKVG